MHKTPNQILREQFQKESKQPTPVKSEAVVQMIGLMGNIAANVVITDIGEMIEQGKRRELDGYIFALTRIIKQEAAWEYVVEGFSKKNETVPAKYVKYFGKTNKDIKPSGRISVQ